MDLSIRGQIVTLSDNESIILERMKDADGTEYEMVFKGPADALQKSAPRDQLEPLFLKGLVTYLVGVAGYGEYGVALTDDGRNAWSQIAHKPVAAQFSELTEDELIALASDLGERLADTWGQMAQRDRTQELIAVVQALKIRRDVTAPARRRVGEYLRQVVIQETKSVYLGSGKGPDGSSYGPRPAEDLIDYKREDEYVGRAELRISDLRWIAPTLVRDTKADFYEEQERRLAILMQHEGAKLPEKQQALLPCIVKGHITRSGYTHSYSGDKSCCGRVDGRTVTALVKKSFIGYRVEIGRVNNGSTLMIKKPVE